MRMFIKIPDKTAEAWKKGLLTISEAQKIAVQQYILDSMDEYDRRQVKQAAERIINIDPYEARNTGETPQTIARQIITDPTTVINYLLEVIEESQK